jgi:hypothetical protein
VNCARQAQVSKLTRDTDLLIQGCRSLTQSVLINTVYEAKDCFLPYSVRSESLCALTKGFESDVHECLYRPDPELN